MNLIAPAWINEPPIDKDGNWTPMWQQAISQLLQVTQNQASPEGLPVPPLASDDIARLTGEQSHNTFVVDATTNELKFNLNGTYKTVTLT